MPKPLLSIDAAPRALEPEEEWRLVQRAQVDRREFGRLYDLHARSVLNYLTRRTGDSHLAEDLTSEAFVKALESLPSLRFRGVPFRHWLLRIAANLAGNRRRQERAQRTEPLDEGARAPVEEDGLDYVRLALDSLAPRFSTVLSLHHIEDLGVEDLARLLGCPVGTIQSRLHRGRVALRKALEQRRKRHEA